MSAPPPETDQPRRQAIAISILLGLLFSWLVLQQSIRSCSDQPLSVHHREQYPDRQWDVNEVTAAQLEQLPGIGPTLAERIVQYRGTHGPVTEVSQLLEVKGIGPTTLERVSPYIMVSPAER